jgi:AcrR family transcriptional regulator
MSTEPALVEVRRRGRPRSTSCHHAAVRATTQLLSERAYGEVTMEAIAQRAGVSKQTLYKWWPSKSKLVIEAYATRLAQTIPIHDTGDVREDLTVLMCDAARAFRRSELGGVMAGLISSAQADEELAGEFREAVVLVRRRKIAGAIESGIARGQLPAGTDAEILMDLLFGALWYRLLMRHAPITEAFARSLVAHTLGGAEARSSARKTRSRP